MAKTSHPFSNPFGKKEGEDRPRRVRQNRFFEHDRNAPTTKFEKLHEIPHEQGDVFKPPVGPDPADVTRNAAFRAVVSGRVQMVMYRDFASRKAQSLGIVGTVRNLPDGTVEVVAEGEQAALHDFLAMLSKGPLLADVRDVRTEWTEPVGTFRNFSII